MSQPKFEVRAINLDTFAIDDHGKTVALLTPQGNVDWLLRSPMQEGAKIDSILKETHLSNSIGLMMQMHTPAPGIVPSRVEGRASDDGRDVIVEIEGKSKSGEFWAMTRASLHTTHRNARYQWDCATTIKSLADKPITFKHGLEYCNIYPAKAGRGFLFESSKEFNSTLMVDRDGTAWRFAHQHLMHYTWCSNGIRTLNFSTPSMAGFFGEKTGAPVCVLKSSPLEPDWGICDMYYDLHCQARTPEPIEPGQEFRFEYDIKYLSPTETKAMLEQSKPVQVSAEDLEKFNYPRLSLGLNSFDRRVEVEGYDDAAGFRPNPPVKVWDREMGHRSRGSLRITNETSQETVWTAEPPVMIPSAHRLRIKAMLKTRGVTGPGAFVRVRYFKFDWRPEPHCETVKVLESDPVDGTSDDWVRIEIPPLDVPSEHYDFLVYIDYVLNGEGIAWLTDVDVDLQPIDEKPPALEAGSDKNRKKRRPKVTTGGGGTLG